MARAKHRSNLDERWTADSPPVGSGDAAGRFKSIGACRRKANTIREVNRLGTELKIEADFLAGAGSSPILESPWSIASVDGGSATAISPTRSRVQFAPPASSGPTPL